MGKFYRLFVANLGRKCLKNQSSKRNVALLFNKICCLCKGSESAMNLLTFVRIFSDYNREQNKMSEAMSKCVDSKRLVTKLFDAIRREFRQQNEEWNGTQKLLLLWTLYECNQKKQIEQIALLSLLKWAQSALKFDELLSIFSEESIDSFSEFSEFVYAHNPMSAMDARMNVEEENAMQDEDETFISADIDGMEDDELFVVDVDLKV